jgi:drug/metabolite transporter (DMT)-like permease
MQIALALVITLVSAFALSVGYLLEHSTVRTLPPLSFRWPIRSTRLLLTAPRWLAGFGTEAIGWLLYTLALALAPLSLVQATAAGGVGILAMLSARMTGLPLSRREWAAVALAISGLALLGISLAGGHGDGSDPGHLAIALWVACSGVAALASVRLLPPITDSGAAFGIAAGLLFAAGDVATKSALEGGGHLAYIAALVVCYTAGTGMLQAGFQRGGPLATAGMATLLTNALPIVAGMTIFGEPLPDGWLGALRIAAFAAVVVGAVFLGERRHGQKGELPVADAPPPEPQPVRG